MFVENPGMIILGIFFGLPTIIIVLLYFLNKKLTKREREKSLKMVDTWEEQEILRQLKKSVLQYFHLTLDTINTKGSRDEIVRIVNLAALQTAMACVEQDKRMRNHRTNPRDGDYNDVSGWKIHWSKIRKLALQIAPELEGRMPHFSEFEPLKSYNAEHLLQKKAEQSAT